MSESIHVLSLTIRPSASVDTCIPSGRAKQGPSELGELATLHCLSPPIRSVLSWWGQRQQKACVLTKGVIGGGCTALWMRGVLDFGPTVSHSVYPHHFLTSFPVQTLMPKHKPLPLQLENGLCSTHIYAHIVMLRIKASFMSCSQPVSSLLIFVCNPTLNHWWDLVRMKGMGKGTQSPSHCKRNISENHFLKVPSCSGIC